MHCHQQNIECHALNDLCIRMLQKYSGLARRYHFAKYSAHVFHFLRPISQFFMFPFFPSRSSSSCNERSLIEKHVSSLKTVLACSKATFFVPLPIFRECFVVFKKRYPKKIYFLCQFLHSKARDFAESPFHFVGKPVFKSARQFENREGYLP